MLARVQTLVDILQLPRVTRQDLALHKQGHNDFNTVKQTVCMKVHAKILLSIGTSTNLYTRVSIRSRSHPEPEYLAGAGAVTLARLRLHLKYLFNKSRKLYGTKPHLIPVVNINNLGPICVLVHVLERTPVF